MFSKNFCCVDCGTEGITNAPRKVRCFTCQGIREKMANRGYREKWKLKMKGDICPRCSVKVSNKGVCEKCAAYVKKWKLENADRYKNANRVYKNKVKKVGLIGRGVGENIGLSCGLVLKRLIEQGYKCVYCGCEISFENSNIDHKIPTSRGGDNADWNVQVLCSGCNTKKGVMTDVEYKALKN